MGKVVYLFNGGEQMSIFDLANFFLYLESMSNKKLQKLCYYAQAWYLALNREPLVDQTFEAWIHGPVCPDLYHRYKQNGYREIPRITEPPGAIIQDQYLKNFIEEIYDIYGHMTADELELLTHNEEPWKNARQDCGPWEPGYNPISHQDMIRFYGDLRK